MAHAGVAGAIHVLLQQKTQPLRLVRFQRASHYPVYCSLYYGDTRNERRESAAAAV